MKFHLQARNVDGDLARNLGGYWTREQAERAAKWLRKWLPSFFTIEIYEDDKGIISSGD